MSRPQLFLLSPANCSGQRAALLFNSRAEFFLARRLRGEGATLGEVFSFLSGLYFRGKLTYARAFVAGAGRDPSLTRRVGVESHIRVITTSRGLLHPDIIVGLEDLREFAGVLIDAKEARYREPLVRDAGELAARLPLDGRAVLLGSVASDKYVEILHAAFGERLVFPAAFVGRGDMSRGGLLLRAVDEGRELEYVPVMGSVRRGARPGKLPPRFAGKTERRRDRETKGRTEQ